MDDKKTGREQFGKYKKILEVLAAMLSKLPRKLLKVMWDGVNGWKGKAGIIMRYCLLKALAESCGDNVYIASDVEIKHMEHLRIGSNVSIHRFCYIDAVGGIDIGSNVSIAHNCSLISFDHTWSDMSVPIKYNPVILRPISIEDDVWIGCGCRILGDTKIASKVVVAAGAVVSRSVEEGVLVGGIPAKMIKQIL